MRELCAEAKVSFFAYDNEKSDETLESTRRMRELCAEAKVSFLPMTTRSLVRLWREHKDVGAVR